MKASDIALLVIAIVLVPIGGVLACVDSALIISRGISMSEALGTISRSGRSPNNGR